MDIYKLSREAIEAVEANDVARLQALRESGESLGLYDILGNTLLHRAIIEFSLQGTRTMEAFEYLLTLPEIDKNQPNLFFDSPLLCAFEMAGNNSFYALRLIESGCELSVQRTDTTSVMQAVKNDWPEVVELLIEEGVDFDMELSNGKTALHLAAELKKTDIVWMLLFYGANPNTWYLTADVSSMPDNGFVKKIDFFDIIYARPDDPLVDRFSSFDKNIGLVTVVQAMERGTDSFNEFLNTISKIHFHHDELKFLLSRLFAFNTTAFQKFFQEYKFIVEEAFLICTNLEDLFHSFNPTMLKNCCANMFLLLESDIVATVVDAINGSREPLILYFIRLFSLEQNQLEPLTQILCCLVSYGVNITPEAMDELFFTFGHCELFRIMLFMTFGERKLNMWPEASWPKLIYDVTVNEKQFLSSLDYHGATSYNIYKYCTAPAIYDRRLPSLLELARRATREYIIINMRSPRNCMQFYKILKKLKITQHCKDIISFRQTLYADDNLFFP